MIALTISILILIGFGNNMLITGADSFTTEGIQGQLIIVALAFVLLFFGVRKLWSEIKRIRQSIFKLPLFEYFTNPNGFIENFLEKDIQKATLFPIWALGAMTMLSQILIAPLMPDSVSLLSDWGYIWFVVMLMSLPVGFVIYVIASYVIYLLVRICKGKKDVRIVRKIYVFSTLPISLMLIVSQLTYTLVYGSSYFNEPIHIGFIYFWITLMFAAMIYAAAFMYISVRSILETSKVRSIIVFLVLPIMLAISNIIPLFVGANSLTPENYLYNKANTEMQNGDFESSKQTYLELIETVENSENTENLALAYLELATIYEVEGNTNTALKTYRAGMKVAQKESAIYYTFQGKEQMLEGEFDSAIASFKKSIELEPDNFAAHNSIGAYLLLRANGDKAVLEEALFYNAYALQLYPNELTVMENTAVNLLELQRFGDAKPIYEAIIEVSPNNAPRLLELAVIELSQGGQIRALKLYNRVLAIDSSIIPEDVAIAFAEIQQK